MDTAERPATLCLTTPCCGRKVRGAAYLEVATDVVRRTCPECSKLWQVIVRPIGPVAQGFAHRLDWTEVVG